MDFYPFPSTVHIFGSLVDNDGDFILQSQEKLILPGHLSLVLQEKVDGTNVSVHFNSSTPFYEPIVQKRSGLIESGSNPAPSPQYATFREYCIGKGEELHQVLGDRFVLFGEWLWKRHAVAYDALIDFFICFDVLDKNSMKFLSSSRLRSLIEPIGLQVVPELGRIEPRASGEEREVDLTQLAQQHTQSSHFCSGGDLAEGVYLRIEDVDHVIDRYKYRRPSFHPGEGSTRHSSERNSLI